ncbi:FMN-binding protein [Streptomyces sp. YS415]|uniref:FMN-binding protein n=1 Tax=Streptomyces sp. YS415 TaxID=2944806 RepID=UPI0020206FA0|nr:FMN-binding protein [Streptomyces sp. YS415]MCL7429213.1 FMN-binding protein [Streptomyces sp. YS415]
MRKTHPIRRAVLAGAATVSGIVLLLSLKPASDPASAAGSAAPQQTAAAQEAAQGGSADRAGTVTGDAVRTQYGPVQVRLTVSGGKVTDVEAVQAPSGGRSTQVTETAVPRLNRAALATQSADIDAVSGATYTSSGYKQSLQSALDKMEKAAGGADAGDSGTGGSAEAGGAPEGGGSAEAAERTVTGETVTTEYGPVQVRITVSGGKITAAEAVQSPSGGQSTRINGNAVPKLNAAAVAAGSADIDAVSGATYTSNGYKQSLQSALDQAGG